MDEKQVANVINATFAALREMMSIENAECRIEIRNFGVFEVKKTKAKVRHECAIFNEILNEDSAMLHAR